ncbi:MAG: hypothetical protein K0S91_775 [Nitrososphaeraceae archaeon]|jgi:hypothetical protein|nr:hypothetical protein [Nitrososphaeraceae archaeon]
MPTYILLDDTCISLFDSDCNCLDYDDADEFSIYMNNPGRCGNC